MKTTMKKNFRMEGADKLKRGEIAEIAEKTYYSESHVSNVINGRRKDTDGTITKAVKAKTARRK